MELDSCISQAERTAEIPQQHRVAFPGINAPVPAGADLEKWGHRPSDLSTQV